MPFPSALAAVESYLRQRERLTAPRSQSLTVTVGTRFGGKCDRCGHSRRVVMTSRKGVTSWRCGRCRAKWPMESLDQIRGEVQGTKRSHFDGPLADLSTIGNMLGRLTLWERRCVLAYVMLGSFRAVHEHMSETYPYCKRGWSYGRVRDLIRKAESKLESQLARAKLL